MNLSPREKDKLMIAVAAMTAIGVITDRIQRSMGEQASEFLGADYLISSPRDIEQTWINKANEKCQKPKFQFFLKVQLFL